MLSLVAGAFGTVSLGESKDKYKTDCAHRGQTLKRSFWTGQHEMRNNDNA